MTVSKEVVGELPVISLLEKQEKSNDWKKKWTN